MNKSVRGADADNVTLTLEERKSMADALAGRQFPCQLCGAGLEIRISRKLKPYTTCLKCGVQNFYRGKIGIYRLRKILDSHLLITANESSVDTVMLLFNRIQQLRAQKKELTGRKALIISDPDLANAILAVDNEIEQMQGDLAKLARKSRREKNK
jgi:hypothetical protein